MATAANVWNSYKKARIQKKTAKNVIRPAGSTTPVVPPQTLGQLYPPAR